jgi:hypothetical protein
MKVYRVRTGMYGDCTGIRTGIAVLTHAWDFIYEKVYRVHGKCHTYHMQLRTRKERE